MAETEAVAKRPGRNEPCHCGSGKKYKQCCLAKDEEADRQARAAAEGTGEAAPAREQRTPRQTPDRRQSDQHWKRAAKDVRTFHKVSGPRKIGSS